MENNSKAVYDVSSVMEEETPINWRRYIYLFLSNWYWFLITIFIALSLAYLKNRYTLPEYRANAVLMIDEEEAGGDVLSEIKSVYKRRRKTDLANEVAKLKSFSLARRTIDNLGWSVSWKSLGRIAMIYPLYEKEPYDFEVDTTSRQWYLNRPFNIAVADSSTFRFYNRNGIDTLLHFGDWYDLNGWRFRISRNENGTVYKKCSFIIYHKNTLAKIYQAKLQVETDEIQGTIIRISSQGKVAMQEVDYLNQLCQSYINTGLERKQKIATNTLNFLEEQIRVIIDSLRNVERKMLAFQINENVVDLSQEGQLAYDKLQSLYDQKTKLSLHKNYYDYLKDYIESKLDPMAIIAPTLVDAQDQLLIDQVNKLQKLYEEREQMSFAAYPDNPAVVQINSQIQTARENILEILNGLIYNNELSMRQIATQEALIEEQLLELPANAQVMQNIQRKYEVNNKYYTFLLQKRAEAGIEKASTISNIVVIDPADHNITATGERTMINYFIALLAAILVPGVVIWLVSRLDPRIKDRSDIESNTSVPTIGIISHNTQKTPTPAFDYPGSAFAEAFRRIRTNLQYILREPDQKVISITSTIAGEGKTFIAMNLAAIIAMNQKRVLLAGFDLRRPSLHRQFKIDNKKGISTCLAGQDNHDELISPTHIENLFVLPAGPVPPNPAELMETPAMGKIIADLKKKFDYIIIDTPPLAVVTDALIVSRHASSNIFVIRQNYSHRDVLSLINKYYNEKQVGNMSLLINDIKYSRIVGYSYYYGYGYEYGYSYGYGYKYRYEDYYNDSED